MRYRDVSFRQLQERRCYARIPREGDAEVRVRPERVFVVTVAAVRFAFGIQHREVADARVPNVIGGERNAKMIDGELLE